MRDPRLANELRRASVDHSHSLPLRLIRWILRRFEDTTRALDTWRFGLLGSWSSTGTMLLWACIAAACLFWPMPTL